MATDTSGLKEPPVRKKGRGCLMILMAAFLMFACVVVAIVGFGMALVSRYSQNLPDVERLRSYQPSETTRIYAADGSLIATLFKENRTWVPFEKVSKSFRDAIVATEDARFYEHGGIDLIGLVRAAITDWHSGGATQGASTITMQLARGIFLHPAPTLQRKIQEMLISIQLEKKFTKSEILELYMNQVYFGSGSYGVEAAAETYFNKKASDLSLPEAAMIAGITPAPSSYSPQVNFRLAKQRQILVLKRMVDVGFITQKEALDAIRQPLKVAEPRPTVTVLKMPYFSTYVLHELFQKYDEDLLYRGGLRVYTTVDPKMQAYAEEAVKWGVSTLGPSFNVHQSALVSIDPKTGYIRAMAGGTGWSDKNQFNRAWQTQRQPGSSFKIFVYLTALEAGYTPDTIVPDSPFSVQIGPNDRWTPQNSGGGFMGPIPLHTALQFSRNVVSARLVYALTPERVIDTAYRMGIKSHIDPNLSIALGAVAVSPLEMASALSTLANGGVRNEVTAIKIIKDPEGNILEDNTFPYQQEVISPMSALAMSQMMQVAVEAGTGTGARIEGRFVAGKTGTTDSKRDAWFCGFIPQLATAVWCGNDDNSQTWGFGGDISAPIWKHYTLNALKAMSKSQAKVRYFMADDKGKVEVSICTETGKRANVLCPSVTHKFFNFKDIPHEFCKKHIYIPPKPERKFNGPVNGPTRESPDETDKETDEQPVHRPEATPMEPDEDQPTAVPPATPGQTPGNTDDHPTPVQVETPDKPAATPERPEKPETAPTTPTPPAPPPPHDQPAAPRPHDQPTPPKPPQSPSAPKPTPTGEDSI